MTTERLMSAITMTMLLYIGGGGGLLVSLLPLLGGGREAANVGVLISYHAASSGAIRSIG